VRQQDLSQHLHWEAGQAEAATRGRAWGQFGGDLRGGWCTDFVWGRAYFLHNSLYGAMFWICVGNSVDNTGMFLLLLSSAYTVNTFSASHTTLSVSRLGVHKKLGGDTARMADGT